MNYIGNILEKQCVLNRLKSQVYELNALNYKNIEGLNSALNPDFISAVEKIGECVNSQTISISVFQHATKDYGYGNSTAGYFRIALLNGGYVNVRAWADDEYEDVGDFCKLNDNAANDSDIEDALIELTDELDFAGSFYQQYWLLLNHAGDDVFDVSHSIPFSTIDALEHYKNQLQTSIELSLQAC